MLYYVNIWYYIDTHFIIYINFNIIGSTFMVTRFVLLPGWLASASSLSLCAAAGRSANVVGII